MTQSAKDIGFQISLFAIARSK
jgi:hypothetical protein